MNELRCAILTLRGLYLIVGFKQPSQYGLQSVRIFADVLIARKQQVVGLEKSGSALHDMSAWGFLSCNPQPWLPADQTIDIARDKCWDLLRRAHVNEPDLFLVQAMLLDKTLDQHGRRRALGERKLGAFELSRLGDAPPHDHALAVGDIATRSEALGWPLVCHQPDRRYITRCRNVQAPAGKRLVHFGCGVEVCHADVEALLGEQAIRYRDRKLCRLAGGFG